MKKNNIDIIVDSNGKIVATAPVGPGYRVIALPGQARHRVEVEEHLINKKSASEIHQAISHLLYFENGVAKLKAHSK